MFHDFYVLFYPDLLRNTCFLARCKTIKFLNTKQFTKKCLHRMIFNSLLIHHYYSLIPLFQSVIRLLIFVVDIQQKPSETHKSTRMRNRLKIAMILLRFYYKPLRYTTLQSIQNSKYLIFIQLVPIRDERQIISRGFICGMGEAKRA